MKQSVYLSLVAAIAAVACPVAVQAEPDENMTIEEMEQALGIRKTSSKAELRFRAPSFEVDTPASASQEAASRPLIQPAPLSSAESSGSFSLPIEFQFGSSEIAPSYWGMISRLAELMKQHGDLTLLIRGHTDSVGSAKANDALSIARAKSVEASLRSLGVPAGRLRTEGLGARSPLPAIRSDDPKNRRVEFVRVQ